MDPRIRLERVGDGRYDARLFVDGTAHRIGVILGRAGSWYAERNNGKTVSCFNTRSEAADALRDAAGFSPARSSPVDDASWVP